MSDQLGAEVATYMKHNKTQQTNIHAVRGIRTPISAMKRTYTADRIASGTGLFDNYVHTSLLTKSEVHDMHVSFHFVHDFISLRHSLLHVLGQ
jgi:hypothetical protein